MAKTMDKYKRRSDQSRGRPASIACLLRASLLLFIMPTMLTLNWFNIDNGQTSSPIMFAAGEPRKLCYLGIFKDSEKVEENLTCKFDYDKTGNGNFILTCSRLFSPTETQPCISEMMPRNFCNLTIETDVLAEFNVMFTLKNFPTCPEKNRTSIKLRVSHFGSDHNPTRLLSEYDLKKSRVDEILLKNGTIRTADIDGPDKTVTHVGPILKQLSPRLIRFRSLKSLTEIGSEEFELTNKEEIKFSIHNSSFRGLFKRGFVLTNLRLLELRHVDLNNDVQDSPIVVNWADCNRPDRTQVIINNTIKNEHKFPEKLVTAPKTNTCNGSRLLELSIVNFGSTTFPSESFRTLLTKAIEPNSGIRLKLTYDTISCCQKDNRWLFPFLADNKQQIRENGLELNIKCRDIQDKLASAIIGADALDSECTQRSKARSFVISLVFIAMATILLITTSCVFMFYVLPRSKGDTISLAANAHLQRSLGGSSTATNENSSATTAKYPSIVEIKSTSTAAKGPVAAVSTSGGGGGAGSSPANALTVASSPSASPQASSTDRSRSNSRNRNKNKMKVAAGKLSSSLVSGAKMASATRRSNASGQSGAMKVAAKQATKQAGKQVGGLAGGGSRSLGSHRPSQQTRSSGSFARKTGTSTTSKAPK